MSNYRYSPMQTTKSRLQSAVNVGKLQQLSNQRNGLQKTML